MLQQAIFNGASEGIVTGALIGIASRLRAAAQLAGVIELACDGADEKSEAAQ